LGRLGKRKRDEIDEMLRNGYSQKEIAEKVGCSISSVQRRKKSIQPQSTGEDPVKALLGSTIFAVFDLASTIAILYEFEELREYASNAINTRLCQFIVDLFEIDLNFAKTILDHSMYSNQVLKLVDVDPSTLDVNSKNHRKTIIEVLKKKYPEKLAALVK
jgi:transcriptional regulator with XRE-family HTH domain